MTTDDDAAPATEHADVLILGAGLSGLATACYLRRRCPDKTFVLLERRDAIGGTWSFFRYPGFRTDSDMHTFGLSFKPWTDAAAANGVGAAKVARAPDDDNNDDDDDFDRFETRPHPPCCRDRCSRTCATPPTSTS